MTPPDDEDLARRRFGIINAVRLAGIAMLLIGIAILSDALGLPDVVGYALVAVGAIDTFLVPTLLARRWSSRGKR